MKALLIGALMAALAGGSLGGVMKPDLGGIGDRPAGPQILAGGAGAHIAGPFER